MAKVLQAHIQKQGLFTNIAGKDYAHVEGWQFAGGLMGLYPRVKEVINLSSGTEKKWQANVEIVRIKDNKVVGWGSAICSNTEQKRRNFDEYAVLSMAQTRAIGKAYRNLIGWVMKLTGMEATPAEEMSSAYVSKTDVKPPLSVAEKFEQALVIIRACKNEKTIQRYDKDINEKGPKIYTKAQMARLNDALMRRSEELK